jgi:hypothetical protein
MDLLEDVAACRGFAQRLLPAFGESPRRGREALREPEPLEMHEPGDERGRLDESGSVRKANLDAAILGAPLELATSDVKRACVTSLVRARWMSISWRGPSSSVAISCAWMRRPFEM